MPGKPTTYTWGSIQAVDSFLRPRIMSIKRRRALSANSVDSDSLMYFKKLLCVRKQKDFIFITKKDAAKR